MKKKIVFTTLLISSILLSACSSSNDNTTDKNEEIHASESAQAEQSSTAPTDEETDNGSQKNESSEEVQPLSDEQKSQINTQLFDGVKNLEVGTAGSSLKSLSLAADWLNVLGEMKVTPEDTTQLFRSYVANLDTGEIDTYKENFTLTTKTIDELVKRSEDDLKQLETAGSSLTDEALDARQWTTIRDSLYQVLDITNDDTKVR